MRNFIYILAIFLVPFDNLFFAPSSGWATVTPILFILFLVLNYKKLFHCIRVNTQGLLFCSAILIYSILIAICSGIPFINIVDTLQTLVLGIGIYFALYTRYIIDKVNYKKDLNILLKGYSFSFLYGLIKFIALRFGIGFILNLFMMIEKRYYPRVAFSFTEPSFIAIHLYGILLVIYLLINDKYYKKRILIKIIMFSTLAIIASSSTRFLLDTVIIVFFVMIYNIFRNDMNIIKKVLMGSAVSILLIVVLSIVTNDGRIQKISNSIYSDPSLASRYFRINASIQGYENHPFYTLTGKGIGGAYYFLHEGYEEAYRDYKSSYTIEIINLYYSYPTQVFCLYVRMISEFGLGWSIVLVTYFISKIIRNKINLLTILIVGYLFIQFDSYAFYSIPFLLFYCVLKEINRENKRNPSIAHC